jgi:hypothetical protein
MTIHRRFYSIVTIVIPWNLCPCLAESVRPQNTIKQAKEIV